MKKYLFALFLLLSGIVNAQYTKLYDLSVPEGTDLWGNLVSDGTFLYGLTERGGTALKGVIYRIKPDGTGYTKLHDFTGIPDGKYPRGSLFYDGTFLYGVTQLGGTSDLGTIFKIKPDGTGYLKIFNFIGPSTGDTPFGGLVSDGTFLYGTTTDEGGSNGGSVYKIMPDGTGYLAIKNFTGTNGSHPYASLIFDGTYLYGTTQRGGISNLGTIFKIMPNGTGFAKIFDFTGTATGSYPEDGALFYDGTYLYGMAHYGAANNKGCLFKIMPNGTGFIKLIDFSGTNGSWPYGVVASDGTFLYATTQQGGTNNKGVLYKIMPDGTGYSKLLDFAGAANGESPYTSLCFLGNTLFGTTCFGGINSRGTIFKYCFPTVGDTAAIACESFNWHGTTYSASSTPTHAYTARWSCDSIVTLHLTIKHNTTGDTSATVCGSFNWYGNTYNTSSSPTHHFTNQVGCDSILTLHLTLNNNVGDTVATTCSSFVWHDSLYTNSVSPTHTYINRFGCDSLVTLHLTINRDSGDTTVTKCDNFFWHNTLYTNSAAPTYTYINSLGCDSVVTLHLTIKNSTTGDTVATACDNFNWHNTNYASTTTATHTYTTNSGCDSVVTLHLTIKNSNSGDTVATACDTFNWHNTTYTSTSTTTYTYTTTGGCDSVVTLHLTINTVDTAISVLGNVITAAAVGATYQWIDCGNSNQPIAGETNQSYTYLSNGDYGVIVSENGCVDTSSCLLITSVGIEQNSEGISLISVYPNPTNSEFMITINSDEQMVIQLYDLRGRLLLSKNNSAKGRIKINIDNYENGIYFLNVRDKSDRVVYSEKIIKQ